MARLKVLIATTTWWPTAAYLAIAFERAGANVYSLSPVGNPLRRLKFLDGGQTYSAKQPNKSLVLALLSFKPDIIIPMDDRTVEHIHALHARANDFGNEDGHAIRVIIERSLGSSSGYSVSGTRYAFLEEMRKRGISVPAGAELSSIDDVRAWCGTQQPPWVIKAEGSWGGSGVLMAKTVADAEKAYKELSSPLAFHKALRFRLVDRDPFTLARFIRRRKRKVMAQQYIAGPQLTCMAACWQGRLLGTVNAEVLSTQGRVGASTLLRLIESADMDAAAAAAAESLGLSGFFGLDFIFDERDGQCLLIEMNPRATQLGHIRVHGTDLVTRLCAATGADLSLPNRCPDHGELIALFPQSLRFIEKSAALDDLPIDIPWSEPALVEELLRLPWTKRGILARLEALIRQNDAFGSAIEPQRINEILGELERRRREFRDGPYEFGASLGGGAAGESLGRYHG
jgi:hypothetical protein